MCCIYRTHHCTCGMRGFVVIIMKHFNHLPQHVELVCLCMNHYSCMTFDLPNLSRLFLFLFQCCHRSRTGCYQTRYPLPPPPPHNLLLIVIFSKSTEIPVIGEGYFEIYFYGKSLGSENCIFNASPG